MRQIKQNHNQQKQSNSQKDHQHGPKIPTKQRRTIHQRKEVNMNLRIVL